MMSIRKLTLAAFITAATLNLGGCYALPVLGIVNTIHNSGTATLEVVGPSTSFPNTFRSVIQKTGGIVKSADAQYGLATYPKEEVRVEYQRLDSGAFEIIFSSDTNMARTYIMEDSIAKKAESVANELANAGFKVSNIERKRGL